MTEQQTQQATQNIPMLEDVLLHIHNRFEVGSSTGAFAVSGGSLEIVGLQVGQYYWVSGSVFNDGLHKQGDTDLTDEEFVGTVSFLAVPKAVKDLAKEIGDWVSGNADALNSPYQSESFDGYSYAKGSGGSDGGDAATWQAHFRDRLNPWRKIA